MPTALGVAGRAQPAQDGEDPRVRAGLEREPGDVRDAGAGERRLERADVLDRAREVVDEQRRPVLAGERLEVRAVEREAVVCRRRGRAAATRWERRSRRVSRRSSARRRPVAEAGLAAGARRGGRAPRASRIARRVTGSANGSGPSATGVPIACEQVARWRRRSRPRRPGTRPRCAPTAARKPLILRTYWRAAASASPVVAGPASSARRSWRMLRHMPAAYPGGEGRCRAARSGLRVGQAWRWPGHRSRTSRESPVDVSARGPPDAPVRTMSAGATHGHAGRHAPRHCAGDDRVSAGGLRCRGVDRSSPVSWHVDRSRGARRDPAGGPYSDPRPGQRAAQQHALEHDEDR